MVIERPRGQSAAWHRFCPVSRYPINNPSFHQRAWILWKDDHVPQAEEAGLSSEMPVVVSGRSIIYICLPDLDLWCLVPLFSAGTEATLPAEYCRKVEPGQSVSCLFLWLHPHQEGSCLRLVTVTGPDCGAQH